MKHVISTPRILVVLSLLVGAALACSAPSAQSTPATADVAQAFTNTPFVVTATPDSAAAAVAPSPTTGAGGSTGGSSGGSGGGSSCLYNSVYVADLTVPDGTQMTTGTPFTKTWRVKNNGCQTWPDGTSLIFVSGSQMGGSPVGVPQTAVGGTQDISVNMTTPASAGDYQGYWQLRTPDGVQFGDKISVKIKATAPAPPPPAATATTVPPSGPSPTPKFTVIQPVVPLVPLLPLLVADFTATYAGSKSCFIGLGHMVKIKNTGTLILKSAYAKFEAPVGTQVNDYSSNDPFIPSNSCNGSTDTELAAGDSAYVLGGAQISAIPSGTSAKITVKLCGDDNLGGVCATHTVTFTIP